MQSPVKLWRNQKFIQELLGKEGSIVTHTLIRVPPNSFSSLAPYPVAVVQLDGGQRITVQVVDYKQEDLVIGARVRVVLRRVTDPTDDGVIPYGIKARPVS